MRIVMRGDTNQFLEKVFYCFHGKLLVNVQVCRFSSLGKIRPIIIARFCVLVNLSVPDSYRPSDALPRIFR